MCTAYDAVVKDFQTNLASFVNVSCITNSTAEFAGQSMENYFWNLFFSRPLKHFPFARRTLRKSWDQSTQIRRL